MKLGEFLQRQMSENGEPSNNRVMLFMFLTTIMLLILAVVVVPVVKPCTAIKLPDIPSSFENFVEYITMILVGGVVIGKGINAYQNKGVASTTTTTTASSVEVKDAVPTGSGTEGK